MWEVQRHLVVDNRLALEALIPSGPAIIPKNEPYAPCIRYQICQIFPHTTLAIVMEISMAEIQYHVTLSMPCNVSYYDNHSLCIIMYAIIF